MNILALDSSAAVASAAIVRDGRLLAEYTLNNGNTHSETLLPMVELLLSHLGLSVADIDLFAASAGPGSFTGVRIGAATLKGLAFASDKPCAEVSTLEAIAENLRVCPGLICPVMNARRSQVYTALFRSDGETVTRLLPDSALSIAELDELLAEYGEPVRFAGDGYDVTLRALAKTQALPVPERLRHQSAASVAAVAARAAEEGKTGSDTAFAVHYLRPSQAERERLEKESNQTNQA